MTDTSSPYVDDRRAKRNVAVLVAAQALLGSQITMIFVVGGLTGQIMSPIACLATLPISLIVFGTMTSAPWMSNLMQSQGRRTGFLVGTFAGMMGAAIGAYAIWIDSFYLFLFGSFITGTYMAAQGFYRFAAADTASDAFRPKAISYVLAGGLLSAIIGPQLVSFLTSGSADNTEMRYFSVYIAAALLNVIGFVIFFGLDIPKPPKVEKGDLGGGRTRGQLMRDPRILVAVICGMVSYGLMNLVMTSTPLAVVGCGYSTADAANVVTGHVLAMFGPSFFTGHLIVRFGVEKIIATGLIILAAAGVVALQGIDLFNFYLALVLLGIGWNFGFIGATTMLTSAHSPAERGRMQGMNDMLIYGLVTLASLASGGLMNCSGGDVVQGWTAVNLAMVPMLALAGGALIWLVMRPKEAV
ncbi:MFS transporter [Nereida sp. MMG025]|uniref:MFS transporter n=1 Tax=Nereida sp. MMG025 TaxID=2909981 RepID=UPI001F0054C5|nr:MFS transporter [Nereida sp. MMG025]MCF6443508.1 MFS transporter [Nereida sp. MMG025]